jgi:hypothetical protein
MYESTARSVVSTNRSRPLFCSLASPLILPKGFLVLRGGRPFSAVMSGMVAAWSHFWTVSPDATESFWLDVVCCWPPAGTRPAGLRAGCKPGQGRSGRCGWGSRLLAGGRLDADGVEGEGGGELDPRMVQGTSWTWKSAQSSSPLTCLLALLNSRPAWTSPVAAGKAATRHNR